jgi:ATP-binding cassette subfamily B protein
LNNILFGNKDATFQDVENITKEVNIYNKIMKLDDKFNANVGTLGGKLSGGEIQRLLLARTFIRNGPIILLDEPTSNLDNNNEKIIFDYLNKIRKDKTILMTAHKYIRVNSRLNTLTICDNIFVLNKGTLVEHGSHYDLMKNAEGHYYNLFTKQGKH